MSPYGRAGRGAQAPPPQDVKKKKLKAKVGLAQKPQMVEIEVPENELPVWDLDAKLKIVGKAAPRIEGPEKVTGQAKYTLDYTPLDLPGLLYAEVLRSPHAHARVTSIDASRAAALDGVKAVMLIAKGAGFDASNALLDVVAEGPVLHPADREVIAEGEEVAVVAAVSEAIAEDALELIDVKYERLPHVVDYEDARKPNAPLVHPGTSSNVIPADPSTAGDIAKGFAEADVTIERNLRVPVLLHNCAEPHAAVARWEGPKLTVWASTQGINDFRDDLAKAFKMDKADIRVITQHMGGGFGSKFGMQNYGALAALMARQAKSPVKLAYDRHEENQVGGNRPNATMWIKIGAKKDGTLTALQCRAYGTAGVGRDAAVTNVMGIVYKCPNRKLEDSDVYTNAGTGLPMRAPGFPQGSFAIESAMDDLADELKMDPLELRRKNMVDLPLLALDEMYTLGAEKIGWSRRAGMGPKTDSPIKRGIGMGTAVWPNYSGPPAVSRVTISPDGSVESAMAVQDLGTGTWSIMAMVTAEELGIPLEAVKVTLGDTRLELNAPASGGSVTALSITPAIRLAAADARRKLFDKVAPAFQAKPEDLVCEDGKISVRGRPGPALTWKEATAKLSAPVSGHGERLPNVEPYGGLPLWGAQFAEVEVDTETGLVRVVKVVAVHEAGRVINPATFEAQIHGGVMMGLGLALLEKRFMDKPEGRVINPNLEDYKMIGPEELPEIETVIVEPITPMNNVGGKGIGEPCTVPTAAAVANAVAHALGVRVAELPLTPDRILDAVAAKKEA
ncbi:MAG TPA: xanthine dehydrogenase family protein molybdopterin-binding subunit [Terriglobia bacterium]|nr:xanthine dehydrogenase family protein molybdopterin-binding subunit [Terriglobia bacterium]